MVESVDSDSRAPLNSGGNDGRADDSRGSTGGADGKMIQSRRKNLRRMLALPLVLMAVVILLVLVGRDLRVRQERLTAMEALGEQISEFREEKGELPAEAEFREFRTTNRTSINSVSYDRERILDDSPADTVLAYTSPLDFLLFESGHAVLYMGGEVEWVNPEALTKMLKKREQRYNASRLSK